MLGTRRFIPAVTALALLPISAAAQETIPSETIRIFDIAEADQGIGVDADHFYVVDNALITKYDKETGALVATWQEAEGGPITHLDSAVIVDGLIYAAHSNYPIWPMTSSIEIWDAETMEHIGTHSFGIDRGILNWVDYYDGSWWGGFGNYDNSGRAALGDREITPYGDKLTTQIVRFDENWRVIEAWVIPPPILERFEVMSNSGGSWGPDGRLYITGHDPAEAYVMELPEAGSVLKWVATVPLEVAGQGIAWDRSQPGIIYGIHRAGGRVVVSRVDLPM